MTLKFKSYYPKYQDYTQENVIMLVVFYECETRSVIAREAIRLKVFENRLPSRISGKRVEVRRERHDYMTVS